MRSVRPYEVDYLLTDPEETLQLRFADDGEDNGPKSFEARRTMQRAGRLDGFCALFTVTFDEENAFSTFQDQQRTHWSTPNFRVDLRECKEGNVLDFRMRIDDIRSMEFSRAEASE